MNKKGFTMIELLAAIVVMGILSVLAITGVTRLIEKSKDEKKEDYAQMLKIAAQSYMEANKGELPKRAGNQTYVTAPTLKDKRYLKEDEGGCVEVHKKSNTTYEYVVKLDGNCKSTDDTADQCEINGTKPVFDELNITDAELNSINLNDPESRSNFEEALLYAKFTGGKEAGRDLKIEGYNYIISLRTDSEPNMHEVYNSGALSGQNQTELTIKRRLKEFMNVTETNTIRITINATNELGCAASKTVTIGRIEDKVNPNCDASSISGAAANENDWIKKGDPENGRIIHINCNDGNGSGCVRERFSRTWPNDYQQDAEWGYIQVKDNAGNASVTDAVANSTNICDANANVQDKCRVRVNVDKHDPSIKVIGAYKADANGKIADQTNHFNTANKTWTDSTGDGSIGYTEYNNIGDNAYWFNGDEYPNGVVYKIEISDNIHLDTWSWATNGTYVTNTTGSAYTAYNTGNDRYASLESTTNWKENCGTKSKVILVGFKGEGKRKGLLTVKDKAGNDLKLSIEANIDRTDPPVPNEVDYTGGSDGIWAKNNIVIKARNAYKRDDMSGPNADTKVELSGWNYFQHKVIKDYDTSFKYEKKGQDFTFNKDYEGQNKIQYLSCDKALNCTEYGKAWRAWVDFTPPKCIVKRDVDATVTGSNNWVGKGSKVTVTSTCSETAESTKTSGCYARGSYKTSYSKEYNSDINTAIAGAVAVDDGGVVTDKAGNTTVCAANQIAKIDTKPPTCSFTGQSTTWALSRTITKSCKDTGVSSVYHSGTVVSNCTSDSTSTVTYQQNNATVTTVAYKDYYISDIAGNKVTCTKDNANNGNPNVNIYVDRQAPTCTVTKSNTTHTDGTHSGAQGNPNGITVKYTCNDAGVKGNNCPSNTTNTTKTKSTWVADKLGNGMTCTATIYTKTEKRYRKKDAAATCTSSCCGYKTCRTSACGCERYNWKQKCSTCGYTYHFTYYNCTGKRCCCNGCQSSCSSSKKCTWHQNHGNGGYETCTTTWACHCSQPHKVCKSCRHSSHGCDRYYSCAASACGAKKCTSVKCCGYKCGTSHWNAWGGSSNGCNSDSRTLYY